MSEDANPEGLPNEDDDFDIEGLTDQQEKDILLTAWETANIVINACREKATEMEVELHGDTVTTKTTAWVDIENSVCGRIGRAREIMNALRAAHIAVDIDTVSGLRLVAEQIQDKILEI